MPWRRVHVAGGRRVAGEGGFHAVPPAARTAPGTRPAADSARSAYPVSLARSRSSILCPVIGEADGSCSVKDLVDQQLRDVRERWRPVPRGSEEGQTCCPKDVVCPRTP